MPPVNFNEIDPPEKEWAPAELTQDQLIRVEALRLAQHASEITPMKQDNFFKRARMYEQFIKGEEVQF